MPNPYVNKVQQADGTVIMDITGTTATQSDVASGKIFFAANGQQVTGTAISEISAESPISVSGATVSHESSGVTAASKGDTTNQTPSWGGTFKALSGTVNATGHLTAFADHTVTIPSAVATTSAAGLMSATDKTKLDGITTITDSEIDEILATIPEGRGAAEGVSF